MGEAGGRVPQPSARSRRALPRRHAHGLAEPLGKEEGNIQINMGFLTAYATIRGPNVLQLE